ncbi:MAG: M28 family peptidase, partial [Candidatus Kariarchaeaceae archaeon]
MRKYFLVVVILTSCFLVTSSIVLYDFGVDNETSLRSSSNIDVNRILRLVSEQLELGPRIPGSEGSIKFKNWLEGQIPSIWNLHTQNFTYDSLEIRNFWLTSSETHPEYIIGAHFDTRAIANMDTQYPDQPVPGASDGASGVAAILELLNHIPSDISKKVGFVLFDAEDQGYYGMKQSNGDSWDWIVGSTHFAQSMTQEQVNQTKG